MKNKFNELLNKIKAFFKVKKHALYAGIITGAVIGFGILCLVTAVAPDENRFEYELMEDGTYKVIDIKNTYRGGIFFKDDLVIPSEYLGKPVSTVEKIRSNHITKITLAEGITTIGNNAFSSSLVLEQINLPSTLTTINNNAFEKCPNLKNIFIPKNVTTVGETIGNDNLEMVFYLEGTEKSGWNLEWTGGRPYYENVVAGSYHRIGEFEYLVSGTKATVTNCFSTKSDLTIPSNVTINGQEYTVDTLGTSSFDRLTSLENVVIPTTVTELGDFVFANCDKLLHTHLSSNVEMVGYDVFTNCKSAVLYTDKLESETSSWAETWNANRPVYFGVGADDFELIDEKYECIIDENNDLILVYYRASETNVEIPAKLTINDVEYDVVSIGKLGFANQQSIKSITLPSSIKTIGESAFENCVVLEKVYLASNINYVGKDAFKGCVELVIYTKHNLLITALWGKNWNAERPYYNNVDEEDIVLVDKYYEYLITGDDTVVFTKFRASYQEMLSSQALKSITINEVTINEKNYKVTEIGCNALESKRALTSFTVGDSVLVINANALKGCEKLNSVTLGSKVKTINSNAFEGCSSLQTIYLENNIISVASNAFANCSQLVIYTTVSKIITDIWGNNWHGERPFYHIDSKDDIKILSNKNNKKQYEYLITGENTVTLVRIFDTTIKEIKIDTVTIEDKTYTVTQIGKKAFGLFNSAVSVYFEGTQEKFLSLALDATVDSKTNTVNCDKAVIYFYSENDPIEAKKQGNYWHYTTEVVDEIEVKKITKWKKYVPETKPETNK